MNKFFTLLVFVLLLGLGCNAEAGSKVNNTLVAEQGFIQFPFFDEKTAVWTYNGKTPGPMLRVKSGEMIKINFVNRLQESSTIHWHGLRIENAMDGVPGVTQPPIEPGDNFIYSLTPPDAGTFWYHPHLNGSEQLERGMKGIFIVEEKQRLPWSKDWAWLLDDWLLMEDGKIFPNFNTHRDLMHDGRWGNVPTINGQVQPEFQVKPGERIRLRLINGANARIFSLDMAGLKADVIAVDGRPVSKIFTYDRFNLAPGNRLDLDIIVPDDAGGKSFVIADRFTRREWPIAMIQVLDEPAIDTPKIKTPTQNDFIPAEIFKTADVSKTWELDAVRGGKYGIGWSMNRKLWPDSDKADFQIGKPQKILFVNKGSRLHPMHIHGVFFRVLERNGNPAVEPFTRDTVLIGPRETVLIGLTPMHSGIWVSHCHIQAHAEAGMMTSIEFSK